MLKKIIVFLFFILAISDVIANEMTKVYIEYGLGYDNFKFEQEKCYYENITGLEIGNYVYPKEVVLSLENAEPYLIVKNNENNKTGLVLKNSDLCIVYYDEENRDINAPFFIGINEESKKLILNGLSIKSSGNYAEKDKIYSPDNLYRLKLNLPWVENDSEYGIGEYLEFELAGYSGERLFSANGFLDLKMKIYLFVYSFDFVFLTF